MIAPLKRLAVHYPDAEHEVFKLLALKKRKEDDAYSTNAYTIKERKRVSAIDSIAKVENNKRIARNATICYIRAALSNSDAFKRIGVDTQVTALAVKDAEIRA